MDEPSEENGEKQMSFTVIKAKEIIRCQIQEWYPLFKLHSFKTSIHELPDSFISYLLDESGPFLLPVSILGNDALPNRISALDLDEDSLVLEGEEGVSSDTKSEGSSESSPAAPCFPSLESEVMSAIEALGGAAFPKLNWSSPKDAAWISTSGSLKCSSLSEIALLLRSSDSAMHDLCHAFDSCDVTDRPKPPLKFFLALRKWYPELRPEMEFRCFIRDRVLVGISQREVTGFYPVLLERKADLEATIMDFCEENIRLKFESNNYVVDLYVTRDNRVKIMDFGPYGAFTLPLLFSWEELEDNFSNGMTEFRIVESQCRVRPGLKTAVPYDYLDTSSGSGWDQFLQQADEVSSRQIKFPEAGA